MKGTGRISEPVIGRALLLFLLASMGSVCVPGASQACVRTSSDKEGACLWWGTRSLHVQVSQLGSDDLADGSEFDAVERSLSTWSNTTCSDFSLVFDGLSSRTDVGYQLARPDNINLIIWRDRLCRDFIPSTDPCWDCVDSGAACCSSLYQCWEYPRAVIAVTSTVFSSKTGELFDADIELNGVDYWFTTVDGPTCVDPASPPLCQTNADCLGTESCFQGSCLVRDCARIDVENTVTHELGHVLGLEHSPVAASTMYPAADQGEISKRSLEADDLECFCDAYPKAEPTRTCFGRELSFESLESHKNTRGCAGCSGGAGQGEGSDPLTLLLALALAMGSPFLSKRVDPKLASFPEEPEVEEK